MNKYHIHLMELIALVLFIAGAIGAINILFYVHLAVTFKTVFGTTALVLFARFLFNRST